MSFLEIAKTFPTPTPQPAKRGRKPKGENSPTFLKESEQIPSDYRPPNWKDSPLSLFETVAAAESIKKKKGELSEAEVVIVHNFEILKSCYRTNEHILRLKNYFIGKSNFDAYYNRFGFTGSEKYAEKDFRTLSGYSSEDDGFNLSNWKRITADLEAPNAFLNPPFNRLEDASRVTNAFVESDNRNPRIAFLGTLDYTNYLQESLRIADYLLMLDRIQFIGMPGIKKSTPRGSVSMLIYNPILEIGNSRFVMFEGNTYYCVDLRKEQNTLNLQQLVLDLGEEQDE